MNKIINKENIGFGGLQWFFWSGYCTFFAFLVLYLKSKGYNEIQIGMAMSAISVASIVGQPFWGNYCDRRKTIRNVLIMCLILSGLVALLIPVFYKSIYIIVLICLFISFTENSMPTIIDSWTVDIANRKPWLDYGLTRGMGSLGYALTAAVFGFMLDKFGYNMMFITHFFLILISVGFCFFNGKNEGVITRECSNTTKIEKSKFEIKESGRFIYFLISSTLVFTGMRAVATFFPLLLNQKGGTNADFGIALFVMALSEVPVLFLSRRLLLKYKDTALIIISMVFFVVRIILHIIVPSVTGLILVQAMQAVSFGLFLPASVYYIKIIAPKGLNSTYLSIATSCYYGVGSILGSFFGGIFIDLFGIYQMFWISAGCAFCGLLIFVFSTSHYNKEIDGFGKQLVLLKNK